MCHQHEKPRGEETRTERLAHLLHACNRVLYYHSGPGQQQNAVLRLLAGGDATPRQVQEALGVRPGSASELITKLENKGLLTRRRRDADRRSVALSLTERGAETLARHIIDRPAQTLLDALPPEEQEQLAALLEKLLRAWKESGVV